MYEYENQTDSIIRDQIVACCSSTKLRRKLLETPNISLQETLKTARSLEAAEMHAKAIEKNETNENNNPQNNPQNNELEELSALRQHRTSSNKRRTEPDWVERARKQEQQHNRKSPADPTCYRCGEPGHRICDKARGKTCSRCGKKNHFAKACRSSQAPREREGGRMRLSDPHNMLSKIAVKRKFLPCKNPTLVPTIITQECPFNSMVFPQHCSLILGPASTCSLYMSIRRSNNKNLSYYLHQHVSIHMVAANHSSTSGNVTSPWTHLAKDPW